jgi:hypothetical protein
MAGARIGKLRNKPLSISAFSGITGKIVCPIPANNELRKILIELISAATLGGGRPA